MSSNISDDDEEQPVAMEQELGGVENEEQPSASSDKEKEDRYSLWLLDRTRGRSHPHLEQKPPLFCCYVPKPIWKLNKLIEQNVLCETTGKIGCVDHDDPTIRKKILSIGLGANILALLITLYACFSISKNFDIIRATSFSQGQVRVLNNTEVFANIDIGLTAVAFENFYSVSPFKEVGQFSISFDSFCK